ncbi:hypothetical protein [Oerskovia turbata]
MEQSAELPRSVELFAEYLARWARSYDNHLKWDEKAKFKAELMNTRRRWLGVDPRAFSAKLLREGMRREDVLELVEWLRKAQAGRRLVPQRSYRDYKFAHPIDEA